MKTLLTKRIYPNNKVIKNCIICGEVYSVFPCRADRTKCCSKSCLAKTWVRTAETRRKIGNATRGKRAAITGEKHYYWKGGTANYCRRLVRERDFDTCQCVSDCRFHVGKCGFSDSSIMHVDHIKPKKLFPELATSIENLLTLCPNCHQHKTNRERRDKIFKRYA